ncbi:glycosyl hydrolase 115 family protein [Parafilimonas terrae]|uniref:Glycosyl hydrolase family 67 N-terminus n=1 Tax=Parafilimonas terrae TaxID=1465490 RepID=A0A1I5YD05_9BACT|nr:glycosyl hydrolase 115 family protein [Parafilimonas terrae]SFQ42078.1 Glycosyl hydrolase family 67 N-terminus [Parafilimonas terrae]
MKIKFIFLLCSAIAFSVTSYTQSFVSEKNTGADFPVVAASQTTSIYVDEHDDWLVHKAASLLQHDIEMITGKKPGVISSLPSSAESIIIIGTIKGSSTINQLIKTKKLNVDDIKDKWEAFTLQTISNPIKGIKNALIIAGSDKRGAAYGTFTLSEQIGVSPWYWWADVPAKKKAEVYVKKGSYTYPSPSVKYRGIFINDEAPAFSGWTKEKFGGVNHLVYEHIFELLLRLKANYLWPAMWGNAFNDDDTLNPILANKWGIVMGTSHHEPMLRAQQEWKRYGSGAWDYTKNDTALRAFWKKGIENMDHHESIVTIGMRGDGDMPMTKGTAIDLLERIVAAQRKIIEEVTGKPASETPQDWALYKEVQDYYDQGMRVPDDVTLLLCDDNWGNIRRLPKLNDKPRKGGYGIYYHFDYVGGPRNYKWINTNNIARVWEQMHLAYEYGARQIWVVNVGDLKPMEFPISFFLDYAYNVNNWNEDNLNDYYTQWAAKQFGKTYSKDIAGVMMKYAQYAARRKPELLDAKTYSLENYYEAERITNDWNALLTSAEKINNELPSEYKDAFYQLVLHPVKAYTNLQNLYTAVARNNFYYKNNSPLANKYADEAKQFYANDSLITLEYNQLNNGKWNHMMDQTHIGYTYWQQPEQQKMPEVKYVFTEPKRSIDSSKLIVKDITLTDVAPDFEPDPPDVNRNIFYELDGYVSIAASHYTNKKDAPGIHWKIIPNIGKDGDGITSFPVTAPTQSINKNTPYLEYEFHTSDTGAFKLNAYFSPTLNFQNDSTGLQYAISIDDEKPQIISINNDENKPRVWDGWAANNIIIKTTNHSINKNGKHTIKYQMISPAVILQKIVLDFGGLKPSYLGPEETIFNLKNN